MMRDVEIALRFFALRHDSEYQKGMKGFLDLYMVRARSFEEEDIEILRDLFDRTMKLGHAIFGGLLFKPWDPRTQEWADKAQVAFADAVAVGLARHLDRAAKLEEKREDIIAATRTLFESHAPGTFTGQKNTKKDVQDRLRLFDEMLDRVLAA